MSEVARIAGIGIIFSVLLVYLRKESAPFGAQAAVAFVVLVLLILLQPIRQVIDAFTALAREAQVSSVYLALVLKAVAIAYITSFSAELSRDAGEDAIGAAVELAGKVFILILSVPVIAAIMDALIRLLPG